ncbi:density-regulated protein homolog [Halyomorpha halys]|uniref:density-regulated protein homolog n=1 Tax=Halyomorpha halys TaxID=286706 RepID=UPI0006D4D865|nr:density-regulated protein homolog [Halyomorpha halys]
MIGQSESETLPIYPLDVSYCGNCSLPLEYCEYQNDYENCKEWLKKNLPSEYAKLIDLGGGEGSNEDKKRQKRGGRAIGKGKSTKKEKEGDRQVCVYRAPRGKKKSVTVVTGLALFGIDLKVAAKFFGTRFACGSSVTGEDEIVIQGDVKEDLIEVIPEKWDCVEESMIEDLGDMKRAL